MPEPTPLFNKLNYKNHGELVVINAPASLEIEIEKMLPLANVHRSLDEFKRTINISICFVNEQDQIKTFSAQIIPKYKGDTVFWFAYPKARSKKYRCYFNRDKGWGLLGSYGFEGVRPVAIDEDWSALRFRHIDYIKSLTRSEEMMMSGKGKERLKKVSEPSI